MAKHKLNYRIHNPNTAETTANFLLRLLIEANQKKVELSILAATQINPPIPEDSKNILHEKSIPHFHS